MITVTGPAVVIILAIGYFGINAIANGIGQLFKKDDNDQDHTDSK